MAPAPVARVDRLAKSYGSRHLFDEASFIIDDGDKMAVVGPNGAGKSTLLRVLAGVETPDHGLVRLRDNLRVHFFEQHPEVPKGATVRDLLATPLPTPAHLANELAELEARIADPALYEQPGYEPVLERYAALEVEIKRARQPPPEAYDNPVVRALGFKERDLDQDARSLSGGERTRLFLGRTLGSVKDGDLVILDEPTNHLDIDTIEWLEGWITDHVGTVLVVAHDRTFLDNVADRVLEVAQGRVTPYPGNYSDYVSLRDEDRDRERREHEKALAELKRTESTIQQFRHQKRFDGQYASRMKMVERRRAQVDRSPDPVIQQVAFGLRFGDVEKSSNEMMRLVGLSKTYGSDGGNGSAAEASKEGAANAKGRAKRVLDRIDLEVLKGDRVGIVGPNGAGKTTLLRIMTGKEAKDDGSIHVAPGVKGVVLAQDHEEQLDVMRTLREEVLDARQTLDDEKVKALIGRFGFRPEEDLLRKVGSLSGGERGRLSLLKAVLKPSNLLVLDEPTNHMDLESREVVARALNSYPGTVVLVSHDRFLLDAVTNKTVVVQGGKVSVFPGTFSETRPSHPRHGLKRVVRKDRYVVRKKFKDWATGEKYLYGDEPSFSKEEIEESRSLRNALFNGWLEKR